MKLDRLLSIVVLLLHRERMTAADLSRRYDVTERTIYRDLDAINLAGVPVIAYPGPGGGFCLDPAYTIDRRLLGLEELGALVSALRGVNAALEDRTIGAALEKIESLGPREGSRDLIEDRVVIDLFPWGGREEERRHVKLIEPAIAERRLISFSYSSYGKKTERRLVEPMTLVFKAYAWYLWAFCRLRGDYRVFKLSRLRDLAIGQERFKRRAASYAPPPEPSSLAYVDLLVRVGPEKAAKAVEWFGAERELEAEGASRFRIRVPEGDWVLDFILGFGPGIEILEPEALRRALSDAAAGLAAANGPRTGI
jgi:predicted DNA-binding transcriptional regulator YafY